MDPTGVCTDARDAAQLHAGASAAASSSSTFTHPARASTHYTPGEPDNHPHETVGRLHLALIKAAFACDLTRVATFMWASGTSWVSFPGNLDGADLRLRGATTVASAPHHPPSHSEDRRRARLAGKD